MKLHGPDRLRWLAKVAIEFVDGHFGDQVRDQPAARLRDAPERTASAQPAANRFGQSAFRGNQKTRVRILFVTVLSRPVGKRARLKKRGNGHAGQRDDVGWYILAW